MRGAQLYSGHAAVDMALDDRVRGADALSLRERCAIAVMWFGRRVHFQTQVLFAFVNRKANRADCRRAQNVKHPIHSSNMGTFAHFCKLGALSC